jgi:hypothetical protein
MLDYFYVSLYLHSVIKIDTTRGSLLVVGWIFCVSGREREFI